jgi:hypothetical protein
VDQTYDGADALATQLLKLGRCELAGERRVSCDFHDVGFCRRRECGGRSSRQANQLLSQPSRIAKRLGLTAVAHVLVVEEDLRHGVRTRKLDALPSPSKIARYVNDAQLEALNAKVTSLLKLCQHISHRVSENGNDYVTKPTAVARENCETAHGRLNLVRGSNLSGVVARHAGPREY